LLRYLVLAQPFEIRQAYRLETVQRQYNPQQATGRHTGGLEEAGAGPARNVSEVWFSTHELFYRFELLFIKEYTTIFGSGQAKIEQKFIIYSS